MDLMGLLSMLGMGGGAGASGGMLGRLSGLKDKLTGLFGGSSGLSGLNWTGGGELPQGEGGGVYAPGGDNPWHGAETGASPGAWYTNPRTLMSMYGINKMLQPKDNSPYPSHQSYMPMSPNGPPNLGGLMASRSRRLGLGRMEFTGGY